MKKLVSIFNKLPKNPEEQKEFLLSMLETIEEYESKFDSVPIQVKRAINSINSLLHVLKNGQRITSTYKHSVKVILQEFDDSIEILDASLDTTIEDTKTHAELVEEFETDIENFKIEDASEAFQLLTEAFVKTRRSKLKASFKLASDLPKRDQPFALTKQDIIPIVGRNLSKAILRYRDLGITVESFEEYFIFKEQTLLAISNDLIKEYNEGKSKKQRMTALDIAELIVNETYNSMSILHPEPVLIKQSTGFLYFWLVPTPLMTEVSKITGIIYEWGLNV